VTPHSPSPTTSSSGCGSRVDEQIEMRATLERSLLPRHCCRCPASRSPRANLPAAMGQQVGGDFYDALRVGDTAVLIVGDVQGKGVERRR